MPGCLVYQLRSAAAEDLGELVPRVLGFEVQEAFAKRLVAACDRAGHLDEMRRQVSARLLAGESPDAEWAHAGMWFEPRRFAELLDQYLVQNTAMTPGLLRLQQLDMLRDRQQILDLARRLRQLDDPQAEFVDLLFFTARSGQIGAAEFRRQLEDHLVAHPEHGLCRWQRMELLASIAPTEFWSEIEAEKEAGAGNPLVRARLEHSAAQAQFAMPGQRAALDSAVSVREVFGNWLAEDVLEILGAEADFHAAADPSAIDQAVERSLGDPAAPAGLVAALRVVRWSDQLARSATLAYRADADRWLERFSASAESWPRNDRLSRWPGAAQDLSGHQKAPFA